MERTSPASAAQREFWSLHQIQPETNSDNILIFVPIPESCDIATIRDVLRRLCLRHEALRTSFRWSAGRLVQFIAGSAEVNVEELDLGANFCGQIVGVEEAALRAAIESPFDFAAGPLLRALVLRAPGKASLLLLTTNHIICDGWSADIARSDVELMLSGQGTLPACGQFTEISDREVNWASDRPLRKEHSYWTQVVHGFEPRLRLPLRTPRHDIKKEIFGRQPATVEIDAWKTGLETVKAAGVLPSALVISAFALSLLPYSADTDVVIGFVYANRRSQRRKAIFGLLANGLPLRIRVAPDATVRALLFEVQKTILGAMRNGEYPMTQLAYDLGYGRSSTRSTKNMWEVSVNLDDESSSPYERTISEPRALELVNAVRRLGRTRVKDYWDGTVMRFWAAPHADNPGPFLEFHREALSETFVLPLAEQISWLLERVPRSLDTAVSDLLRSYDQPPGFRRD